MEITGTLEINIPNLLPPAETLAFKKTSLDILHALPTAAHLEMAAASVNSRWDNTAGIDEMNAGMIAHKDELKTFPDALLVELAGIMSFHVPDGPPINGFPPRKAQALMAMIHWKEQPNSRQLITARLLANLHATVRHIENRKFRKGDIADFVTAQVALPNAHAFFTDKALANLLADQRSISRSTVPAKCCRVSTALQRISRLYERLTGRHRLEFYIGGQRLRQSPQLRFRPTAPRCSASRIWEAS